MTMDTRDSRQIEREAAAWLARREGGAWTDRDGAGLEEWLAASTAHRVALLRLEAAWSACGRLQALGAGLHEGGAIPPRGQWSGLPEHDPPRQYTARVQAPRKRGALAAGALVVLAVGGALAWGWRPFAASEAAFHATAAGEMRTIALADGSSVTLSSASAIEVHLSRSERRIVLEHGEAYFSVAADRQRPFVVAAGTRKAVAVGTRFAVRRDPEETRIVVTEGVVRLEAQVVPDGSPAPSALLTAGSIANARGSSVLVRTGTVADAEQVVSWRSGYLSFHDTPLATAVAEFNRYGSRQLVVGDAAVATLRIGGHFRWSNSEAFARLLEEGFGVRIEWQTDRIVFYSREGP